MQKFTRSVIAAAVLLSTTLEISAQVFDPGFKSPLVLRQGFVMQIRPASDGKIYVLGDFDFYGVRSVGELVRLTSAGLLDTGFNFQLPDGYEVVEFEVLPNGNIVLLVQGIIVGARQLLLLAPDGHQLATSEEIAVTTIEPLPDNSFLVGDANGSVWKYTPAFSVDTNFRLFTDDHIGDIEVLGSKVYVSGAFAHVYDGPGGTTSYDRSKIARFNMDGTVDQSFMANSAAFGPARKILVQPDGKVIPLNSNGAIRLNSNGTVDSGFTFGYPSFVIQDAYYVAGKITALSTQRIVRVNSNGSVDSSFQPVVFDPTGVQMITFPDNSVIAANLIRGTYGMAKYNSSGVKQSYSAQLMRYGMINAMDRTATSIYIAGDFIKVNDHMTRNVARLNPNGSVLTKFKVSTLYEPATGVEAFADARSIISTPTKLHRLVHDGTFDPSFNYVRPAGMNSISKFMVQNDGKILVGAPSKIFRQNNNGSRDLSFNAAIGGLSGGYYFDFDLDRTTGKIIFTGRYNGEPAPQRNNLTRLNPNGSIDNSFVPQFPLHDAPFAHVIFLDNLQVLFTGLAAYHYNGVGYYAVKGNSNGSANVEFLENYSDGNDSHGDFQVLHRFSGRILLSTNYFYSQSAFTEVVYQNGIIDHGFSFPGGMVINWLAGYYSDNNHELFVLGQITPATGARRTSIVKLLHNDPAISSRAGDGQPAESSISFYPNPSQDFITVNATGRLRIYDQFGQQRIETDLPDNSNTIDITDLAPGTYVLQVAVDGKLLRQHFLKK
jgi:uncharacterized delta-60 repeat protein